MSTAADLRRALREYDVRDIIAVLANTLASTGNGGGGPEPGVSCARVTISEQAGPHTYTASVPIPQNSVLLGIFLRGFAPFDADTFPIDIGSVTDQGTDPVRFLNGEDWLQSGIDEYGVAVDSLGVAGADAAKLMWNTAAPASFGGLAQCLLLADGEVTVSATSTGAGGTTGVMTIEVYYAETTTVDSAVTVGP